MGRVVVVLLCLDSRIRDAVHDYVQSEVFADLLPSFGQIPHRELLGELIEDAELATLGGILDREAYTLDRVDDVQEAARLTTLAVNAEGIAHHGLNAEAVESRAEHLVVVEASAKPLVEIRLLRPNPVDNPLVQVGRAQVPDPAPEVNVV